MKVLLTLPKLVYNPTNSSITIKYAITRQTKRFFSSPPTATKENNNTVQPEAPKPNIRWFYASDVPISKPDWYNYEKIKEPESFIPFSEYDSKKLEHHYRKQTKDPIDVNEDKLFEVNLENFNISPVYWEGPVYEVRRGLWFDLDGIPLNSELTAEIEKGFNNVKPYLFDTSESDKKKKTAKGNKDKISSFNKLEKKSDDDQGKVDLEKEKDVIRLSNGQLVLFFNKNQAVIFPGDYDSALQIEVIRYFGPSPVSLLGVTHIQRGYSEALNESIFDKLPENPLPGLSDVFKQEIGSILGGGSKDSKIEDGETKTTNDNDVDDIHMQKMFESDYDLDTSKVKADREIDHLVLCIHGIGQVLGSKYESVNFTHNINILRNTMRRVFEENSDYQKLAYQDGEISTHNNRVQVLPISWRHRIGFNPQQKFDKDKPSRLPALSQINVEGIKALRDVVGDVVLDVLLFYQPRYLTQIISAVTSELNRVYKLYKERNPNFNGKVHILGHSLGSAIAFDILSGQSNSSRGPLDVEKDLEFNVENLFLLGSPVGMFKLLEEKNIKGGGRNATTKASDYVSPKCKNLYNIFHPCDPVAYRIEPLVSPQYGNFRPANVQFAVKGFNTQIKELAEFGDELTERISLATKWLTKSKPKKTSTAKSIEEKALDENALGDILKGIITDHSGSHDDEPIKLRKKEIKGSQLEPLLELNNTGRIDHSLPVGVLDFSLISAISAHISYFEDENTSGFILRELLTNREEPVEKVTVTIE
ncbi:hypothetical protein G210_0035 [Candida maltosa Xu316]|uniref:DDHD domain-containing protein n=1 Tax=Candida maltosa (strain Xu316) TaxID=1245528 RepID=M3HTF3_CANMX|nr:hypothetical protein G210_0035 [Candida maltosa Xu316]